jgi:hypothetical protein
LTANQGTLLVRCLAAVAGVLYERTDRDVPLNELISAAVDVYGEHFDPATPAGQAELQQAVLEVLVS